MATSIEPPKRNNEEIFWVPGTALPPELAADSDPFLTSLVPRPTAWITVWDGVSGVEKDVKVALVVCMD